MKNSVESIWGNCTATWASSQGPTCTFWVAAEKNTCFKHAKGKKTYLLDSALFYKVTYGKIQQIKQETFQKSKLLVEIVNEIYHFEQMIWQQPQEIRGSHK